MRKILLIIFFIIFFAVMEFILFNVFGPWCMPHLLLLLIIFVTLYFGIRYGLVAAFLAGIVKDSLSVGIFGTSIFSFVVCAFMSAILKKYLYHTRSYGSRLFLVFCVSIVDLSIHAVLYFYRMGGISDFEHIPLSFFLPALIATLLLTTTVFYRLKLCVSKFYV